MATRSRSTAATRWKTCSGSGLEDLQLPRRRGLSRGRQSAEGGDFVCGVHSPRLENTCVRSRGAIVSISSRIDVNGRQNKVKSEKKKKPEETNIEYTKRTPKKIPVLFFFRVDFFYITASTSATLILGRLESEIYKPECLPRNCVSLFRSIS